MPYPHLDDLVCEPIDLHGGCVDRRWLRAGTTIIAHEGIFHLAESAFHLDGLAVRAQQHLREGEAHQVGQTGWVDLSSAEGGRALCVARPSALRRVAQAVTAWLRQWTAGSVRPL
jgi:hypothetical protein